MWMSEAHTSFCSNILGSFIYGCFVSSQQRYPFIRFVLALKKTRLNILFMHNHGAQWWRFCDWWNKTLVIIHIVECSGNCDHMRFIGKSKTQHEQKSLFLSNQQKISQTNAIIIAKILLFLREYHSKDFTRRFFYAKQIAKQIV